MRVKRQVKKVVGADIEFGNVLVNGDVARGDGRYGEESSWRAADLLLAEAEGVREPKSQWGWGANIRDVGRCWTDGFCVYIDLGHIELCAPEALRASDHVAALGAMIWKLCEYEARARAQLPVGRSLVVSANNMDGTRETSWGGHVNVTVSRALFRDIFERKAHLLGMLASYLAATANLFGQGCVLPGEMEGARYVLCQRAHQTGLLVDPSTTQCYRRPLVNSRDEAHAGPGLARLHVICFDTALMQVSAWLRTWLTQAFLSAIESGWYDPRLQLDDPVGAMQRWSRGIAPGTALPVATVRTVGGERLTLVDYLERLTEGLVPMLESGEIPEEHVPETSDVLPVWLDTLQKLRRADIAGLSRRLDWALKYMLLEKERMARGLDWPAPELGLLDQLYARIDPEVGLYRKMERAGYVERVVTDERIEAISRDGVEDTRSWARTRILRRFASKVREVNWSRLVLAMDDSYWGGRELHVSLGDPGGHTKQELEEAIEGASDVADLGRRLGPGLVEEYASRSIRAVQPLRPYDWSTDSGSNAGRDGTNGLWYPGTGYGYSGGGYGYSGGGYGYSGRQERGDDDER